MIQRLTMTGVFSTLGEAMVAAGIAAGTVPPVVSMGGRLVSGWELHAAAAAAAYVGWRGLY